MPPCWPSTRTRWNSSSLSPTGSSHRRASSPSSPPPPSSPAPGETADAVQRYRQLAVRDDLAAHYRQLALLQAVRLEAGTADPQAALAELAPLIETSPYSLLARELAAALHLKAGDREAAHAELQAILADPRATAGLRLRARELLIASGGDAARPIRLSGPASG